MGELLQFGFYKARHERMSRAYFDWLLEYEVEPDWRTRWPVLQYVYGHRQREVYNYIKATNPFWDKIYADGLVCNWGYTTPIKTAFEYQSLVPGRFRGRWHRKDHEDVTGPRIPLHG
jgi:hypothetical protein